jgi:hypothetical protein
MKTLLAAALLFGASSVIGHVEWEILDCWPTLERAGYTDVRLQRLLQLWTGAAIKDGRKVIFTLILRVTSSTPSHIIK